MFDQPKVRNRIQVGIVIGWVMLLIVFDLLLNLFWNPQFLNKITYNIDPDSSVFAYGGKLVVDGKLPYRDFWDHKPPAVFYMDALIIRLGGTSQWAFWWSGMVWIALTTIVVFLVLRKLSGTIAAILASAIFLVAIMYPGYFVGGNMPETYGTLPQALIIGATFLLFSSGKLRWAFIAGLLTAIAFLFKQTIISPGIGAFLAVIFLGFNTHAWRKATGYLVFFLLGAAIPLVLIMLIWAVAGAFGDLWDAVVLYNLVYVNGSTSLASLANTLRILFAEFPLMPIAFMTLGAGIVFVVRGRAWLLPNPAGAAQARANFIPDEENGRRYSFLAVFLAIPFGVIFVALGGRNFLHYYITLLPVFAAACAYLFMQLSRADSFPARFKILQPIIIFLLAVAGMIWLSNAFLAERPQAGVRNSLSKLFDRDIPLSPSAQYVLEHTQPDDSILIWGNNISLYLQTGRRNPSRYLYPQPLFLPSQGTESRFDEFFQDLQRDPPELIFGLDANTFGLPTISVPDGELCPQCIFPAVQGMQQLKIFVNQHYVLLPVDASTNVYQRLH